jgi:RNA polymerase sigma-70 factor (ECF subfamily)
MQYLAELSPPLRRAFELRDLDELTTSEAAHILGVAEGTVKAQVSRARAKLRRLMSRTLDAQRPPTPASTVMAVVGRKQDKTRADHESAAVLV